MISLNYTILFQIVNFLICLFILKKLIINPVLGIMARRDAENGKLTDSAASLQERAAVKLQQYEDRLVKVRLDMVAQREAFKQDAEQGAQQRMDEAAAQSRGIRQDAADRLAGESAAAKAELRGKIDAYADMAVNKLLGA